MDKAIISYFSGTGNCKRTAQILGRFFKGKNYQTQIVNISTSNPKDFNPAKFNIFIFPVYCFSMPQIMKKYLRRLPPSPGTNASVIATFGAQDAEKAGDEGRSLVQARKILTDKGFNVLYSDAVAYPSNFTQVVNVMPENVEEKVYEVSDLKVAQMAEKILREEIYHKPCLKIKAFVISLFDWMFSIFGRVFMGKLYVADKKCNSCGICVKECPAHTIKLIGGKPFWNYSCQACQRCINICPEKAIETSFVRLIVFTSLFIAFVIKLIGALVHGGLILAFSYLCIYVIFFAVLDFIIRQFEKVKFLSPLLTLSHTKKYRRYIAKELP
ncbi:MAG TPA: EFR1 family ferrodoxin [Elusimicrobiales bacterium]|nr:EFR1 family ferrodoxin [Elusimicrobiales bacterium]